MNINFDEYGEVVNGEGTYAFTAAHLLHSKQPVLLGWTDGEGSHHDILIARGVAIAEVNKPNIQGGIRAGDLFVSVMRVGAFAFEIKDRELHPNYVGEKLGMSGVTCDRLTDLINGIIKWLPHV